MAGGNHGLVVNSSTIKGDGRKSSEYKSMNILCSKCLQEKDPQCFNFKSKKDGIRQAHCRECQKEYKKKHYNKDKTRYKARSILSKAQSVQRNREYIIAFLSTNNCVDCGESDWEVLDFDHIRENKAGNVSQLVMNACSLKKIQDEIDKCVVRCANCHRRKTRIQFNWWKPDNAAVV